MTEVVRFELAEGSTVLVEVDDDSLGIKRVSRGRDGVREACHRLTEALGSVRDAARASMEVLQTLSPGRIELEFGVKLAGEAGAIIAKTAAEGHFTVTLTWESDVGASNGAQVAGAPALAGARSPRRE